MQRSQSVLLFFILLFTQIGFSQTDTTLYYYNGTANSTVEFNIPFLQKLATRFDVSQESKLLKIEYYVESISKGSAFNLQLIDVNSGIPSLEFFGPKTINISGLGWNEIDLSSENIIIDDDFFVSFELFDNALVSFGCEFNEPVTDRLYFHDCCNWQGMFEKDVLAKVTLSSDITNSIAETHQPDHFDLIQAYPNPFNANTTIKVSLEKAQYTSIDIFNTNGIKIKTIVNNQFIDTNSTFLWNGTNDAGKECATGVYFIHLSGETINLTRKINMIK